MKKQPLLLLIVILFILSCQSGSKKESVTESTTTDAPAAENTATGNNLEQAADVNQKRIEELKKISPVSNEALKSVFPEEVMGIRRSSFSVNSAMGYATGNAEYKKDDTTSYKISIYDCAGEAGSAFYGMQFLTGMNMEREDDNGYEKTTQFLGNKAFETFHKSSNQYTVQFVAAERFWVSAEGDHTGLDNLNKFAEALDLGRLKNLK